MGQTINVTVRQGASPDVRFFDLDRSLTGMGIERYEAGQPIVGRRPADVLAGRLVDLGAQSVTVYSSVVAVRIPEARWPEVEASVVFTLEHLFEYYGDDAGWSHSALGVSSELEPAAEAAVEAPSS